MKKLSAFVLALALILSLGACSSGSTAPAKAPAGSDVPDSAAAVASMSIDDVMSKIEGQASQQFEKCKVFLQDNIIVVQVWETGMANTASLALSSDSLADQWAEMAESMRQTSEQTKGAIDSSGNEDYHIAYYLMNDENDENMLISTLDDLLTYDVVSGLDRLNVGGQ